MFKVLRSKASKHTMNVFAQLSLVYAHLVTAIIFTQSMTQVLISSRNALRATRKCFLHDLCPLAQSF